MARTIVLPDRSLMEVYEGETDEQAFAKARQWFPNLFVQEAAPVKPSEEKGDFMRGIADYVPQMKSIYGAAKVATGVGVQKAFGKGEYTDEMIKAGLETIKTSEEITKSRAKETDSFTNAWKKGIGSVVTDYIPYMLGQGVGNIGESLAFSAAGAGIGALSGSAIPVAGTAAGGVGGALTGLLAKSLLKTEVKEIAKKLAAEQGIKVAEAYVAKETAKIAPRVLGSAIGSFAGTAVQAGFHGVGEVAGRAIEELQKEGKDVREMDFNTVAPAMLVHAGADFIATRIGLGSLKAVPKEGQNLFSAIAENILKTGLKEIPAELTQQVAERFGAKLNLVDADAMREYVDTVAAAFVQPGIGATFGGVRSYMAGKALNVAPKTEFDQTFLNYLQENKASGNFLSNSDSLYDARDKALSSVTVGSNITVYDSVGRDAEAMITGYTETGIPTIKVDASGTARNFILGQEFEVISPVNKDIRLSDNTPVSQLSNEDVQNKIAILKPLVESNRIEQAKGNDLVQHHVMERDLAALVAQDTINATIPVSAKAAINKGNKEKRDRVKANANGIPIVNTEAITPLTPSVEATTEPLAAPEEIAAVTPLPAVDQAAEAAKQAAIDAAIEADAFKRLQEETPPSAETLQRNRVLAAVQQSVDNDFLESIRETIGDLELQPDTKKSQVTAYAKKLLKQGIITEAELEPILRISKDRDMGVEDITSELSLSVENYFSNKLPKYSKAGKATPAYKANTGAQKLVATIKEERQKKQYEAALPRVALLIAKRMKQLGLDKYIKVDKLQSIVEVGADGKPSMEGKINGAYAKQIIELAIAGKSDAQIMSTLNHEAIHAMRELGMITESEWANLTKVVENKGWINFFQIPTRYTSQNLGGKTEDEILTILSKEDYFQKTVNGKSVPQTKVEIKEQLVEEAIADAFSTYATGRSPILGYLDAEQTKPVYIYKAQLKLGGQPVGIITRLIKMLRGIREVATGEDVFKRIQEAPMASAVAVTPAAVAVSSTKDIKVVNSDINLQEQKDDSRDKKAKLSATTRQRSGDGGGRTGISRFTPLPMAPSVKSVYGPDRRIVEVAERYAEENGIDLKRQSEYVQVDPVRGKRLADAYEEMAHDPQDPVVKEAYKNLIEQTTAQYRALEDAGYKFWFIDTDIPDNLNYLKSPWNAIRNIRANKEMGVFPTTSGYGTEEFDTSNNPMLASTGIEWPNGGIDGSLKPVLANDLFRAVHDAFGHGLEGAGFRADGEENAWQGHIRMYTGSAKGAITSETRGQNSVVNYGPNAEFNRTANAADTIYADQKTGLMPEWTWSEGISKDEPTFQELNAKQDAEMFRKAVDRVKRGRSMAFPLHVHDVNTYRNARLFLSKDKESGFALIGDEIGSFFSGGGGQAYPTLRLAVAEGGKRIDAYRSVMPKVLGKAGFRPVARVKFDPKQATDIWNYKKFAQFQGGKPDLVFFVHDAGFKGDINEETAKAPLVDYSKAVDIQTKSVTDKPTIRYSIAPSVNSKEFKQWFGKSTTVNSNGTPQGWYHATAHNIESFERKTNRGDKIFLTLNPSFADGFAYDSKIELTKRLLLGDLLPKEFEQAKTDAIKNFTNLYNERNEKPILDKFKLEIKNSNQKTADNSESNGGPSGEVREMLKEAAAERQPWAPNVMKLYVKAENPFDYENPTHVKKVVDEVNKTSYQGRDVIKTGYISTGPWDRIESKEFQNAIQKLGFDSFYVKEEGNKNLAVYKSSQVKSATGNIGSYGERSLTKDELKQEGITAEEANTRQKLGYIRYSATSPVWYSELSRQIDKLPQKEMTAAEWKALLVNPAETKSRGVRGPDNKVIPGKFITTEVPATSKLPGVKLKEIDDTEILEWLDVAGTSFEVDDYIDVLNKKYGTKDVIEGPYGVTRITSAWEDSDITVDELRTLKNAQSGGHKNTTISTAQVQQFLADGGSKIEFQDVILGGAPKRKFKLTNVGEARRFAEKFTALVNMSDEDVVDTANEWAAVEADNPTQFNAYQLPGGKNYREAFVTVPFSGESKADAIARRDATWKRISERIDFPRGEHQLYQVKWARENVPTLFEEWTSASDSANEFNVAGSWKDGHGSYSGINNPVVRIRFNDRTDVDGNKVLFLEELQPPNNPEFGKMPKSLQDRWLAIGLKRMIRHAAEENYDKIAWTTGEQQVERYSNALREKVDSIEWEKTPEGVHIKGYGSSEFGNFMPEDVFDNVNAALRRNDQLGFDTLSQARRGLLDDGLGTAWLDRWDMRGAPAEDIAAMQAYIDEKLKKTKELVADTTYKETDLTQAIGKLMADRIRNDPSQTGTIEGEDLSIDSVGVKKLYDVGVPALANKILKEMGGGKVGETVLSHKIPETKTHKIVEMPEGGYGIEELNTGYIISTTTDYDAAVREIEYYSNKHKKEIKEASFDMTQPSFDITTPLREKAMSGVPRYSKVAKTEEQKAVDKGNLRVKGAAIREEKLGSAAIVSARPGNVVATVSGITPDKIKNLHRRAAAIINTKAAQAFFATLGATEVEARTIGGLWKGVAEPSFFLTAKDANGDNLSYDKMRGIAAILGSAFQQDAAITSEGLNKPKTTDKVNTTLFLGKSDGSVLNEREITNVFNELSNLKIDGASITTDNKAFKVLWFPNDKISNEQNEQNLETFSTNLRDAVKIHGIDGYYLGYAHSNLDDLLEKKDGVYRSKSKESLREAWDTDVAGRSSLLFGGATDHFLVPYILSVKAEGGQFDFNRWQFLNQATDAERTGLEQKVLAYDAIVNEVGLSPEEAASVNLLIGRTGLGNKDTFAIGTVGGLPAIVRYLDEQRNASGLRKLDVSNEDDRETLSKLMSAEAVAAVRGSGNAIDWYDAEIKKTLDIMAVKYPELTTDPVARLAFRIAMAITSQTLNVEANFRFAMKQYEGFRNSKSLRKFPIDGMGKSIAPMKANFTKANYLLAALGPTTFPRFLVTDFTVKELSNMGIKINGESIDTNLLGSVVFGPKIGYGFLSNLMGNFEPTTFDMWFMRMVGRLTGNLPQFKQNLFDNQVADFIGSFDDVGTDGVYADKFDPKLLRDVANSTDDADVLKLAKKVVNAHETDYKEYREQYDPKFGIPTRYRTPFVSAAFGIVKSLEKPKDSPANGTERNNLRDVMNKFVAKMTKLNGGVRIPPAALQALVWYPEQFLYESMGAKLQVTGQSYSGAATKIIKETKITPQQKDAVEKIASRQNVVGVAIEKAAVPFTQAEKSDFLNKYKNKFNISVKESDNEDVIQDIENETPSKKLKVTTKPFSIARFIGDSSKEKRSVVPDTNFYRENSYMMSLADYMGKPIYLYVGTEKDTQYQKPYGLMHILDNAARSTARRFESLTDNDSENAVRGVMNILGARDVVAYSETAGMVLLRSESNKAYVVLGDSMSGWSVISVVPSMDARKFGNATINRGQKVTLEEKFFPARLFANAPLVRSVEFVPYPKAPSVEVKKRRVVEIPKMSIARYSGATIPKYPTTLLGGAIIPRAWQSPASDKLTNLQYVFTDKFIDLKNVMKAITSTIGQVSDQFNAYLKEELFHGRVAKQVFDFAKDELRPLLAAMQSLNVTIPEIELYLQNRAAESYNDKIAAIGGMADGGSGILTADARAYLASISPAKLYAYTSLASRVDAMTKQTRELMVAGGLEDRATINTWEATNPQYVPLQRDLGRDEGVSGMGQGFSVTHKIARAMGSAKTVKDILANIVAARERTIVKSEKNKIGQAVLGLALKAPNPDYWLAIDPNGNKNKAANFTALLNMGLSINEATMIAQEPKVRYTDSVTGMIAERVNPMIRNMPNVLHVMVNGKERLVIFNPDTKHPANRLVRTLKNLDIGELGPILGWVSKVTRWIAAVNTQYNPIFGVINFLRDYQTGLLNLTSTPLAGMQGQIAGDTFPAMMGIFAQMRSYKTGVPATSQWSKLYERFEKAGGPTGYREMFATAEDRSDALASEFKQLTEGTTKKIGRGVLDALSNYNTGMENAVRLAAFKSGLDKGLSEDQAASVAKNLTVNFNRKGEIAMQAGALYAFFNASAQGSARIAQTLAGPAGRKILGGALTLGVMQAVALAAAGFGDDEPPEFIKDKNIVIPTGNGKYITIPMPLGFNIVPSFSRMMTEVMFYGKGNQTKKIVGWMNGAFGSLNPLGGGVAAQTIFPSAVDPIIALLQNKDAFGRRIYKEDISGLTPTAGYLRTKETATPWAKGLAEFMNMATGGTQFKQGIISPTPDQIDYLIGQATGGIGRESAKIAQTISSSATGEELPSYKIPLVSRFFGDTKEGASEANKFYDNLIRVNEHGVELKGYREHRGSGNAALYIKENPEARLVPMARHTQEILFNLNKQKRLALERNLPKERVKQIEQLARLQMHRFNERVEAMR